MRETWYILEDGTPGDPALVGTDDAGVLRHRDGRAVAYGPHGPRSSGVDADAERAKAAGGKREAPKAKDREMKAEPRSGYKTR